MTTRNITKGRAMNKASATLIPIPGGRKIGAPIATFVT